MLLANITNYNTYVYDKQTTVIEFQSVGEWMSENWQFINQS